MKLRTTLATALVLVATAAQAANVPLSTSYGTAAGCAAHAGAADAPDGDKTLISADDVRFEGNVCPYTNVTEAGEKAWQVKIACESGHDEVVRGTLELTESADGAALSVVLKDGNGPNGDFQPCDATDK